MCISPLAYSSGAALNPITVNPHCSSFPAYQEGMLICFCRHLQTMPPAVMLEKVAALRKAAQSDEGEADMSKGFSFRRPAGRSGNSHVGHCVTRQLASDKTGPVSFPATTSDYILSNEHMGFSSVGVHCRRSQSMVQLGTGRVVLADQAQQEARDIEPCEGMLEV